MDNETEEINLTDFIEAYEELTTLQLWDWLVANEYIKPESD